MKWVKASERLPEKNGAYHTRYISSGVIYVTHYRKQSKSILQRDMNDVEWLDESTPASLEQEAERLYPHPQETYVSPDGVTKMYSNDNKCKAEGYITAARQYMGEIEKLRAENAGLRKALEDCCNDYNELQEQANRWKEESGR